MVPKEWLTGKHWEPLVVPAIVILVGLSAFALGRLSVVAGQGALQVVTGENP